jgi:hypothetical protein
MFTTIGFERDTSTTTDATCRARARNSNFELIRRTQG